MLLNRPILKIQDSVLNIPGNDASFFPQPASECLGEADLILVTPYENVFSYLYLVLL